MNIYNLVVDGEFVLPVFIVINAGFKYFILFIPLKTYHCLWSKVYCQVFFSWTGNWKSKKCPKIIYKFWSHLGFSEGNK